MALHVVGVRHHSPACARLVEETIVRVRPAFVLVEGPSDMNERLDELLLPHALPVALFTYRQDADGAHRGSWSPFCDYSPEWVALRAARAVEATPLFIDLPAWHEAFEGEENRFSDRHVRMSDRIGDVATQLGFENIDTMWDHLFEQPQPLEALRSALDRYFDSLRADEPGGPRDEPREAFMCRFVKWVMNESDGKDVVVVCGGFHKPAIEAQWGAADGVKPMLEEPPHTRIGSYLVPFSFERLDSFAGYASGMPSPAFYQRLWDEGHARAPEMMMFEAIAHLRKKQQPVSPADAIATSTLAHGLRTLRGHETLARVDVLDALAGALVKDSLESPLPWTRRGTLSARTEPLLVEIVAAFSGSRVGALAEGTPQPPLVADAFRELERVGIRIGREPQRVQVALTEKKGADQSAILHRLRVLAIPGIVLVRGPSLARTKTDLSEQWTVQRILETDPSLVEAALYGATLETAASAKLEERSRDAKDVRVVADTLFDAVLCGLSSLTTRALVDLVRLVAVEASFDALGGALSRLLSLRRGELVLGPHATKELAQVIAACVDRGCWLFEGITGPTLTLDEAHVSAVRALRDALRIGRPEIDVDPVRIEELCRRRTADREAPPALRGAALGVLWSTGDELLETRAVAVLKSVARPETFGDFLGGLFALAREEVLRAPELLATIDASIVGFLREDFLVALPALRLAFSFFPPRERLIVAEAILGDARIDPRELLEAPVDAAAVHLAAALEKKVTQIATRYGLGDHRDEVES